MSIIKAVKIATTQVADGVAAPMGFVINQYSATEEFQELAKVTIDTALLSEADALIVSNFVALVNAQLLAS